jgi:sulfur-oxidizing protein SoxY
VPAQRAGWWERFSNHPVAFGATPPRRGGEDSIAVGAASPCQGQDPVAFARRRLILQGFAAGACLLVVRPAAAASADLAVALRETFGDRPITPGRVTLELPRLAENGNVVPVTVSVDSPMTEQDYVKAIHLFAEHNPLPRMLEVYLGPHNGRARIASRIRIATSQQIRAVAVMSDETLWSAAVDVEVTVAGCGT